MKAQVSFEYLLVAAVIALVAIPATYVFYRYSQSSSDEVREAQVLKFGRDVVNTAELVYYQGAPSRITLEQTLPDDVQNISVLRDWNTGINEFFIAAEFGGQQNEFAFSSDVNVLGFFDQAALAQGVKEVRLQAANAPDGTPFVLVTIGGSCRISTDYSVPLATCEGCVGSPAEGGCAACDYDGNCQISQPDVNILDALP